MVARYSSALALAACLVAAPAAAQQGVPYFPQTLQSGTVVGRLSAGPGPTEAISTAALLNALFPNGQTASSFNVGSIIYNGSVSGTLTVAPQAVAGNYSLFWPSTVGVSNSCLTEAVSGSIATLSWSTCALVGANNAFTGTNTHAGTETFNGAANFTSTFQKSGVTQTFPASGNLVGTTDAQTLTNKSIDAGQLTGTVAIALRPLTSATAALGAPVSLNNTANYFDGPSMAQGTTGTWFASGSVTFSSSTADTIICKLWDGTTVIAIGAQNIAAGTNDVMGLSGILASPAANIRISCKDASAINGTIVSTSDGQIKASTVSGIRLQ